MPSPIIIEYKKELAMQLIKRFGLTTARKTCIQNHWDEVLIILDDINKTH